MFKNKGEQNAFYYYQLLKYERHPVIFFNLNITMIQLNKTLFLSNINNW